MSDGSVTIDTNLDNKGFKSGLGKLGSIAKAGLVGVTAAVGAVATAFGGLVVASVKARGELEQVAGGAKKIFDEMDYSKIEKDAQEAYRTMNLSATEYLNMINSVGATFASTMGDEKGYETAKKGMQAIADYASGTGADVNTLNEKYKMITRSTTSYLSIADQFSGILPQTTDDFLKQAQSAGFLSSEYKKLNDVPVAEYQQAISAMLEKGVGDMGLLGNTVAETETTLTGSMNAMKASFENFLSGSGDLSQVVESATNVVTNIVRIVNEAMPQIMDSIMASFPQLLELGMQILNQIITGIITYLPQLMDSAGQILNNLAQGIITVLPQLIPVALQVIQMLVNGLISYLPQILQTGIQILTQLISGIAQMLPDLIPIAVDCIITIVETLIDNIDLIIDAGIDLILALADGLIEALPKLIEKAPIIIQKLVDAFVRNFPKIVKAGGELIGKLVMGILGSIVKLAETAPKLIQTIQNGLRDGFETIKNAGKYLIEGLWNGIAGMASWVGQKVREFAGNIVGNIKSALGIHSPSTVFRDEVGKFMALGIGEGFSKNLKSVYSQMQNAVDIETSKLSSNLTANTTANITRNANITATLDEINNDREIVVNAITNLDGKVLTQSVNRVNSRQRLQYGLA